MILIGPRQLNSPVDFLSSNARTISPAEFGAALFSSTAPTAARFLDRPAAAGIGNLLADRILCMPKSCRVDRPAIWTPTRWPICNGPRGTDLSA